MELRVGPNFGLSFLRVVLLMGFSLFFFLEQLSVYVVRHSLNIYLIDFSMGRICMLFPWEGFVRASFFSKLYELLFIVVFYIFSFLCVLCWQILRKILHVFNCIVIRVEYEL